MTSSKSQQLLNLSRSNQQQNCVYAGPLIYNSVLYFFKLIMYFICKIRVTINVA